MFVNVVIMSVGGLEEAEGAMRGLRGRKFQRTVSAYVRIGGRPNRGDTARRGMEMQGGMGTGPFCAEGLGGGVVCT